MKKRRIKNSSRQGRGMPQREPKKSFAQKNGSDLSDFDGSDVDSVDFYHDEIDDFHVGQEKILLGDDRDSKVDLSSGEEEVLPITDEEDDDDMDEEAAGEGMDEELENESDEHSLHKSGSDMESDLDDKSDDGLPNLEAWGKKKSTYYGADFVDKDRGKSYRPEDEEEAAAEEAAAVDVLKVMNVGLAADDVGFSYVRVEKKSADDSEVQHVKTDQNDLSRENCIRMLQKDAPEFVLLDQDFRKYITELIERISPLYKLVEDGQIKGTGAEYLIMKHNLIVLYLMNISFYMMLKSKGSPVTFHPVMKRLGQYKKILNNLEPVENLRKFEMDYMLEKLMNGEKIEFRTKPDSGHEEENAPVDLHASRNHLALKRPLEAETPEVSKKSKKQEVKKSYSLTETETEREVSSLYMDMKKKQKDARLLLSSDDDEEPEKEDDDYDESNEMVEFVNDEGGVMDEKRAITYEIAKNKGLLPYRKKEYRNPRVRNRMKYKRAKIRRKGQVREPRKELTRYGGELTGIRTDVAKSIKIK